LKVWVEIVGCKNELKVLVESLGFHKLKYHRNFHV
jgi:hypothetical protein